MEILKERDKVESFLESLKDPSQERLIMLDYDGTLAPFVVDRQHAIPYEGIVELLDTILKSKKNKLVVITGRNASDILKFLPLKHPFEIFGGHGAERLMPDGRLIKMPLDDAVKNAFKRFKKWATVKGWNDHVDEKHGSLAFHIRGLSQQDAASQLNYAREKMGELSKNTLLEMKDFDGGIELRVPGCHKGAVVDTILSEVSAKTLATYLGDDLTDEDAFKALGSRGVSVLVRPTFRETAADVWISPPDELKDWLSRFILPNE